MGRIQGGGEARPESGALGSSKKGGTTSSGGKITGEKEGESGSSVLWVASHCVILSTLLLTCRMRELHQGMAKGLLSHVS